VPAERKSTNQPAAERGAPALGGSSLYSQRTLTRIAPLVLTGIAVLAIAIALGPVHNSRLLIASIALLPVIVGMAIWVPWRRINRHWQLAPIIVAFVAVAFARDATGGADSLVASLLLLPVIWVAFYGSRNEVLFVLAALGVTLTVPALFQGPPLYPDMQAVEAACLWLALATGVIFASRNLTADVRRIAEGYRSIIDTAQDAFIAMNQDGTIVEWNRYAEQLFGWERHEVLGESLDDVIIPSRLRQAHRQGLRRFLVSGQGDYMIGNRRTVPALHRDGGELMVEVSLASQETRDGYVFYAFLHDVSNRMLSERALREAEERFRSAFDDAAVGMSIVSPEGRWLRVNQALSDITGYSQARLTRMGFADITHPDDLSGDLGALDELINGTRQRYTAEKRYRHADGHTVWIALSVSTVRGEHGELLYLISQMQDITERKAAEARLAHQALHDPLTGLPNRTLFSDRMMVARARLRRGGTIGILFCDLDGFKDINDRFGHETGDRVLAEGAGRMSSVVRPSDTIARLGGDEFAILCEGIDERGAIAVADRITEALEAPIRVPAGDLKISASIGIVITEDPDLRPDMLLHSADSAMYAAKRAGGGRYAIVRDASSENPAFDLA
jgi:diguanylate cyclase (GGDEF)-like protein/PAS domain S-box-containing protein